MRTSEEEEMWRGMVWKEVIWKGRGWWRFKDLFLNQ